MATQVATTTAPQSDKVIPLLHIRHHHFAHEEQVKNSDQGNDFVIKERRARKNERRARKNPLPASDLAKVPVDSSASLKQQIAYIQQKLNEMTPAEKAKLLAQIQANLSRIQENLVQFVKAVSGKPHVGSEEPKFDAWNQSILSEFTAFATTEMNQNSKIMVGWADQQKAQNLILQDAAAEEKKNANEITNSKTPNLLAVGICAIIGFAALALVVVLSGGTALPAIALGLVGAAAAGLGSYFGTKSMIDQGSDVSFFASSSPDQGKLSTMNIVQQFYSAVSQAANNQITSGSQTNVVNASSNDTSLGQQASQVIQAMRQLLSIQMK